MSYLECKICSKHSLRHCMQRVQFRHFTRKSALLANNLFPSVNKPEGHAIRKKTAPKPFSNWSFSSITDVEPLIETSPSSITQNFEVGTQRSKQQEAAAAWKFWLKGSDVANGKDKLTFKHNHLWSTEEECSFVGAEISLQARLQRMRECLSLDVAARCKQEVLMTGGGRHLGVDVAWSLRWRADGAFVEELKAQHMSYKWGHSGIPGANAWEVDNTGISKQLNYDDHESVLLAAWVRTGCWLYPEAGSQLDMHLVPNEEFPEDRAVDESSSSSEEAICGGAGSMPAEEQFTVAIRLKHGKMVAKVHVCSLDYHPMSLSQPLCGDVEFWKFDNWKEWEPSLHYPSTIHHSACAGGHHEYRAEACQLLPLTSSALLFQMPTTPLLPLDAHYDAAVSPVVEAWKTKSGHLLVQVQLDRQSTGGYVILDTGASGFVIEASAAEELQLEQFGELYVAGIAGKVRSKFRKANSLTIGPLTIKDPIFMEMNLSGLVRGTPGPVVGIVGYDVFRRAIVEIPQGTQEPPFSVETADGDVTLTTAADRQGSVGPHVASVQGMKRDSSGQQCHLLLHDPSKYSKDEEDRWGWYPMEMIANLPHLSAIFECASGEQHQALFMLDSGAGGADLMFHSRAVHELGLLKEEPGKRTVKLLKGVGGKQVNSMRVHSMELPWLRLSRLRFDNVRCLFAGAGGLDISLYSSGLICADLMMRSTVVLDYARQRIGFLKSAVASLAEGASEAQQTNTAHNKLQGKHQCR